MLLDFLRTPGQPPPQGLCPAIPLHGEFFPKRVSSLLLLLTYYLLRETLPGPPTHIPSQKHSISYSSLVFFIARVITLYIMYFFNLLCLFLSSTGTQFPKERDCFIHCCISTYCLVIGSKCFLSE